MLVCYFIYVSIFVVKEFHLNNDSAGNDTPFVCFNLCCKRISFEQEEIGNKASEGKSFNLCCKRISFEHKYIFVKIYPWVMFQSLL